MPVKSFKLPNIKRCNLHNLWWETSEGKKLFPSKRQLRQCWMGPEPKKYPYAFSRFPLQIITTCYQRRKDGGYGGRDMLFRGESGASPGLVIALVLIMKCSLQDALIISSAACERCMNILAWKLGLKWGYSPESDHAKKCRTKCELCR